jgi:hypothetical protein
LAKLLETVKTTHHISSYDDYDALMARVTGKLRTFVPPRNAIEMEYDVGDENDNLDYAWGKDGKVRAYYLGQHSVKVIQIISVAQSHLEAGASRLQPGWFDSRIWSRALLVAEFRKDDIVGSNTNVTGKVITVDDGVSRVIGVFDIDVDRGTWHSIVNGLAWTYDSAGAVGGAFSESFGANVDAAGDGLRSVGTGIVVIGGAVGSGLNTAGELIGDGLGSVVGGTTNFFGNIAYNMAVKAFYESGYIQAATAIAIVLVLIDLKKNKII